MAGRFHEKRRRTAHQPSAAYGLVRGDIGVSSWHRRLKAIARYGAIRRPSSSPLSADAHCPAPEPPRRAEAAAPDSGRFGHGPERAPFRPATPRRVPAARISPLDAATVRRQAPGPKKRASGWPKDEPPVARLGKDDDMSMRNRRFRLVKTGPALRRGRWEVRPSG